MTNESADNKYDLEYYMSFARELVSMGAHGFAIKDMAGLLTPAGATRLVGALRAEFPDVPIHVHTHDTAGAGVASMLASIDAGADVVDGAVDAMSGLTSQPSLGALVANARGNPAAMSLPLDALEPLNRYWEDVRSMCVRRARVVGVVVPFSSLEPCPPALRSASARRRPQRRWKPTRPLPRPRRGTAPIDKPHTTGPRDTPRAAWHGAVASPPAARRPPPPPPPPGTRRSSRASSRAARTSTSTRCREASTRTCSSSPSNSGSPASDTRVLF